MGTLVDQPAEAIGLYHALYGSGCRHAAAGLVRDILLSEMRSPTVAGRMILVRCLQPPSQERWLGPLESQHLPAVEDLLPLLRDPGRLDGSQAQERVWREGGR